VVKTSTARVLRTTLERACVATTEEVDDFAWDSYDLELTEAFATWGGMATNQQLAEHTGLSPDAVQTRLRVPVRCAWIAQQLYRVIPQRLGLIWGVMYGRAMAGDIKAAKLVFERFEPLFAPQDKKPITATQINVSGDLNLSKLTDEDLAARYATLRERAPLNLDDGDGPEEEGEPSSVPDSTQEAEGVPGCEGTTEDLPGSEPVG
jgi:hypothetical protein